MPVVLFYDKWVLLHVQCCLLSDKWVLLHILNVPSHHGTMTVYFKSERSYTIHHSCKWTLAYFWCGPSWLGKCNIIINLVDVKLYKRCWWQIINRLWLNQSVAKLTWKVLSNAYLVMELMGVLMILLQIWFQVTSGEAKEQKTDVCGGFSESQPVGVHGVPCPGRGSMGQKVTCQEWFSECFPSSGTCIRNICT